MYGRRKISKNYKLLRNILSKTRQIEITPDMSYIIIYAFLYKHCSDILKDHFLSVIEDKEITLDEAYRMPEYRMEFKNDAFNMFGFYIPEVGLFLDDLINEKYSERFFIHEFINAFSKNVEFPSDSRDEEYFKFIFDSLSAGININKFEFEGENHLIVKDLVYSISKLDIFEQEFPFERVFDRICDSKLIRLERDPEYITSVLSDIVISQKSVLDDVYNPFLNDASSIINLANNYEMGIKNTHAKGSDRISYCASIVKFCINYYDLDYVFMEYGSPFQSDDITASEFDVIISRIPALTARSFKRLNAYQRGNLAKRKKEKQLKSIISETFGVDEEEFANNLELQSSLEDLVSKMDVADDPYDDFTGEYEILRGSEYLFLVNLINSLKDDGIMALSLPQSFLAKNTLQTLRKYLTKRKNYLDCVISIPDELSRPKRPDVIVVFRKNKTTDDVVFIDLSEEYSTSQVRYPVSGTFRGNLILDKKTREKLISTYNKRQIIERFSNVVKIKELEENEFNLSTSRYVDTFEGEFVRLEDLKHQKEEITTNIRQLNKKIDMMMDDLGIKF